MSGARKRVGSPEGAGPPLAWSQPLLRRRHRSKRKEASIDDCEGAPRSPPGRSRSSLYLHLPKTPPRRLARTCLPRSFIARQRSLEATVEWWTAATVWLPLVFIETARNVREFYCDETPLVRQDLYGRRSLVFSPRGAPTSAGCGPQLNGRPGWSSRRGMVGWSTAVLGRGVQSFVMDNCPSLFSRPALYPKPVPPSACQIRWVRGGVLLGGGAACVG